MKNENFLKLKEILLAEKSAAKEVDYLFNSLRNSEDRKETEVIKSQIERIMNYIKKENENVLEILNAIYIGKPLKKENDNAKEISFSEIPAVIEENRKKKIPRGKMPAGTKLTTLEKDIIKRLKRKKEKKEKEKIKKPSNYVKTANKVFQNLSKTLMDQGVFTSIQRDLIKTNIELIPISYVSIILLSTLIAFIISFFLTIFFYFFSIKDFPLISLAGESFLVRLPKVIWLIFFVPIATFFFMYVYPSLEKKSAEGKINQELPFATIHMATIAGSSIEPSKIFSIIIATKEYPALQKEFTKLINFINIYGYDLVNSLRKVASASPSRKLADLLNSLATTINSGGDLPDFFNKRSQSLLFDYRLEREKYIKFSETFMDIYISVVIAAPMMLMLLLIIMKISGLGLSLSSGMISLVMVMGVSIINIAFLSFLHLKQSREG